MPQITRKELVSFLRNLRTHGSPILTVEIENEPEFKKRDNPYVGRVRKRTRINGSIGPDYEAAVNRARERQGEEPDFEARARSWGTRGEDAFITYGGKLYVVLHERSRGNSQYLLDGAPIDVEQLKPFFPSRKPRSEEVVKYRNVFVGNVRAVVYGGETYEVQGD